MPATEQATFDYIVVGSGAGGGPVAANLASAGFSVLLIEAGYNYSDLNYSVPGFHGQSTEDPHMRWDYFVRHYSDQAQQEKDSKYVATFDGQPVDGILYPRSGTLGGCTAHNAMITIYPHNSDWEALDAIAKTYDPNDNSWNPDRMRLYFERIERCGYITKQDSDADKYRHGYTGWLATEVADLALALGDFELLRTVIGAAHATLKNLYFVSLDKLLDAIEQILEDAPGLANLFKVPTEAEKKSLAERLLDPNRYQVTLGRREGVFLIPLAVNQGQRNGTRERILQAKNAQAGKLTVWENTYVTKIVFEGKKAVGVEYAKGDKLYQAAPVNGAARGKPSETGTVRVNREVVISGGTFNTPQLLMLSGRRTGEAISLQALAKIPVVADLPAVGSYLQDRYEVGIISDAPSNYTILGENRFRKPENGEQPDPALIQWEKDHTGVYSTNGAVISIIRRSSPSLDDPDLFIFGLPAAFKGYYPYYADTLESQHNKFTWAILKAHTKNKGGYVKLRSTDPFTRPEINFKYFEEGTDHGGDDLHAVVEGVNFVHQFTSSMGLKSHLLVGKNRPTPSMDDRQAISDWVKQEAWGHHACGTCRMGPKDDVQTSALDTNFKVKGVEGLRVVDASVFPSIPGFFIVTPIYIIAEKASEAILKDAGWKPPAGAPLPLPPVAWGT